jgi:predicted CopG family antitoxin
MAQSQAKDWTTITVTREVHADLEEAKPYDSMSYDEFIQELIGEHKRGH